MSFIFQLLYLAIDNSEESGKHLPTIIFALYSQLLKFDTLQIMIHFTNLVTVEKLIARLRLQCPVFHIRRIYHEKLLNVY